MLTWGRNTEYRRRLLAEKMQGNALGLSGLSFGATEYYAVKGVV